MTIDKLYKEYYIINGIGIEIVNFGVSLDIIDDIKGMIREAFIAGYNKGKESAFEYLDPKED